MQQLEEYLRKHPNATMHAFYDKDTNSFTVRFYDNVRGNPIEGGHGLSLKFAAEKACERAEKASV